MNDTPSAMPLFYTEEEVCALTGLVPDDLRELTEHYSLVALHLATGESVYPQFQFASDGFSSEAVRLINAFRGSGLTGWEITTWLHATNDLISGEMPIEIFMREGYSPRLQLLCSTSADLLTLVAS